MDGMYLWGPGKLMDVWAREVVFWGIGDKICWFALDFISLSDSKIL